jgi:hypothetical protein
LKDALEEMAKNINKMLTGLESGLTAAVKQSPLWIRQEFASQARQKLSTSLDTYLMALFVGFEDNVLIAELDETDWLANAVESGAEPFDMRKTLLKGKVKTSKAGWKYKSIPIQKKPNAKRPGTEKGQDIHDRLVSALKDPVFVLKSSKGMGDATVNMEKLVTSDPKLQGLYRVRKFKSMQDASRNKDFLSSQFVMFKTISNNPASLAKGGQPSWQHPGITGVNIFDSVQSWIDSTLPDLFNTTVKQHLEAAMRDK